MDRNVALVLNKKRYINVEFQNADVATLSRCNGLFCVFLADRLYRSFGVSDL